MTSAPPALARLVLVTLAAGVCLVTATAWAAERTDVVTTDSGPVRGIVQGDLHSYRGIPYAAPPLGDLRWNAPRRPKAWKTILEAERFGPSCPQNADLGAFAKAGGDEDCLHLNVFVSTKAARSGRKLPVFVWIHGGGLRVGAGSDYDAGKLAVDGDVVVVSINYRLGLLGFLAHPDLDREGHAFANYGLQDQQFALGWVQRNIAAFGGDPGNVTISGESSGGTSVLFLVVAPSSAGTFQHAIVMSGGAVAIRFPNFGSPKPLEFAQEVGTRFAKAAGCHSNVPKCLRGLSAAAILAMQGPYTSNQAFVDGRTIPMPPNEAFRSGKFNRVTLINGNTLEEGTFFAYSLQERSGKAMTEEGYPAALQGFFGERAPEVARQYPLSDFSQPAEAYAAAVTDMLFACSARAINRWTADKMPTYAYEFSDRTAPSYLPPSTFALGATHTSELAYVFPGFYGGTGTPVTLNPLQARLSDTMIRYWASAHRAGERESEWPRYVPELDNYLTLTLPAPYVKPQRYGDSHRCAFWEQAGIY